MGKASKVVEAEQESKSESMIKRIASEVAPIVQQADRLIIRTDREYELAGGFLKTVKGFLSDIEEGEIGQIDRSTKAARAAAIALRKRAEEPLLRAEAILKPKIALYIREQQQAKIREEARLRREEQERRELEAEQKRLDEANRLAELGKADEAAEVIEQELVIEPVKKSQVYVPPIVKVQGISIKTTYRAELVDFNLLIKAVADGRVDRMALSPNMVFLNERARDAKDTDKLGYPGVVVVSSDSVASGKG
jgi:hypothetical protein